MFLFQFFHSPPNVDPGISNANLYEFFWVRFAKIDTSAGELFLEERHWADAESLEPTELESLSWQDGEPRGRKNEWCGCFRGDIGRLMHDCKCHLRAQLICEISEWSIQSSPCELCEE